MARMSLGLAKDSRPWTSTTIRNCVKFNWKPLQKSQYCNSTEIEHYFLWGLKFLFFVTAVFPLLQLLSQVGLEYPWSRQFPF